MYLSASPIGSPSTSPPVGPSLLSPPPSSTKKPQTLLPTMTFTVWLLVLCAHLATLARSLLTSPRTKPQVPKDSLDEGTLSTSAPTSVRRAISMSVPSTPSLLNQAGSSSRTPSNSSSSGGGMMMATPKASASASPSAESASQSNLSMMLSGSAPPTSMVTRALDGSNGATAPLSDGALAATGATPAATASPTAADESNWSWKWGWGRLPAVSHSQLPNTAGSSDSAGGAGGAGAVKADDAVAEAILLSGKNQSFSQSFLHIFKKSQPEYLVKQAPEGEGYYYQAYASDGDDDEDDEDDDVYHDFESDDEMLQFEPDDECSSSLSTSSTNGTAGSAAASAASGAGSSGTLGARHPSGNALPKVASLINFDDPPLYVGPQRESTSKSSSGTTSELASSTESTGSTSDAVVPATPTKQASPTAITAAATLSPSTLAAEAATTSSSSFFAKSHIEMSLCGRLLFDPASHHDEAVRRRCDTPSWNTLAPPDIVCCAARGSRNAGRSFSRTS